MSFNDSFNDINITIFPKIKLRENHKKIISYNKKRIKYHFWISLEKLIPKILMYFTKKVI